mgnify:CR=1 FL=1
MELMGNDDLLSEEALEGMWADSMQQAQVPNARITYDDFLLLMKGQSTEAPAVDPLESSLSRLQTTKLCAVPEGQSGFKSIGEEEPETPDDKTATVSLPSGEKADAEGKLKQTRNSFKGLLPRTDSPVLQVHSAPVSPAKPLDGADLDELDSPLSMDEEDDVNNTMQQRSAFRDLTPPQTPIRGAEDYITPLSGRHSVEFNTKNIESITVPGLPTKAPTLYVRRRSRSVDDKDDQDNEKEEVERVERVFNLDSRRATFLPEHNHTQSEIEALVKDESKSALVVNRKLYRAHRQMRLAVLEASKRFEEQQAQHAKEVLLARQTDEGGGSDELDEVNKPFHAGLVMKHGHTKHVSSEAINQMLRDNQVEQQALVEKATRRGGRGRRTRKKTISDMSGMLATSYGQDELDKMASDAASSENNASEAFTSKSNSDRAVGGGVLGTPTVPEDGLVDHEVREPTVPGNFRRTSDPFGKDGQYGHVHQI